MDFLEKNWLVIWQHFWLFATVAVGGLIAGWGSARFFYSERLALLKERLEANPKQGVINATVSAKIVYPSSGAHGRNLLANATHEVKVGEVLSLRAEIPDGEHLHVKLLGLPAIYLDDGNAGWSMSVMGNRNWVVSTYAQTKEGGEQHFDAESGIADLSIRFSREGQFRVLTTVGSGAVGSEKLVSVRKA